MPLRDVLRYSIITIVILVVAGFALKFWSKHQTKKEVLAELQSLTSNAASFEQDFVEDAHKTLFRTIYVLHRAQSELGMPPRDTLTEVFAPRKGSSFDSRKPDLSLEQELIMDALLRNYEKCRSLGALEAGVSLNALKDGQPPQIQSGPAAGGFVVIRHIIDPEQAPGVDKILPNLVISPRSEDEMEVVTPFQIAQARELIREFDNARLIDKDSSRKLIDYYEQLAESNQKPEPEEEKDED